MATSSDRIDPHAALSEYDLGAIHEVTAAGGTAGRTWKVAASSGDYFLRLRGVRTSTEARLRFDHGLRVHLIDRGIPTASAVQTRGGDRWVRRGGRVFDLYPFIAGRPFCPGDEREIANAARALAKFHEAAADYAPFPKEGFRGIFGTSSPLGPTKSPQPPLQRGSEELGPLYERGDKKVDPLCEREERRLSTPKPARETIAQYTTLGFSAEVSDRMDDPRLQVINMLAARELAATADDRRLVDGCIARVERSTHAYSGAAYDRLAGWIIHGDYTPANLLFSGDGQVVGIFDFDWSMPGARCRDVADGLYFFATRPRRIDSSDIWSLTAAADFARDPCLIFLKAYQSVSPLALNEIEAIPWAFAGRWFSIRLEGMAKVHESERFRFFSRDIERPLLWLDANWADLKKQLM